MKTVLDSVGFQTADDFEIIISEDGDAPEVRKFIESYPFKHPWQHLTQEDTGWRKNRALNRAIVAARSEQLIFIDGDCVLHPRFIEMYIRNFRPGCILAGSRVMLNETYSKRILADSRLILRMQPVIWKALFSHGGIRRPEEGLFVPGLNRLRDLTHLTGCNMSFAKSDILAINGFNEDYISPAYGEDADLTWRFKMAGYPVCSMRNQAVQYHLDHPRTWTDDAANRAIGDALRQRGEFVCKNGIDRHLSVISGSDLLRKQIEILMQGADGFVVASVADILGCQAVAERDDASDVVIARSARRNDSLDLDTTFDFHGFEPQIVGRRGEGEKFAPVENLVSENMRRVKDAADSGSEIKRRFLQRLGSLPLFVRNYPPQCCLNAWYSIY